MIFFKNIFFFQIYSPKIIKILLEVAMNTATRILLDFSKIVNTFFLNIPEKDAKKYCPLKLQIFDQR